MGDQTIELDPGDALVERLVAIVAERKLGEVFVVGVGEVEDVEISVPRGDQARHSVKLPGTSDLVTLSGVVGARADLYATVAQQGESGPLMLAGKLLSATAVTVRVSLPRAASAARPEMTSPPQTAPSPQTTSPRPIELPSSQPRTAPQGNMTQPETLPTLPPVAAPQAAASEQRDSRPLATKLVRPVAADEENDIYPEQGDIVTHFAFGRCVVTFSDGERIRLQQEGEQRVREVALSMLKIKEPTVEADGRRHFDLGRKN